MVACEQMDPALRRWLCSPDIPIAVIVTFLVSVVFVILVFRAVVLNDHNEEDAVTYRIPIPKQCDWDWQGDVPEQPSIRTPDSTAIQCYCPADGRLLGLVNPATADGIDRAIARAKDAQALWCRTTFKTRRKVLRTLLRYILDNQDSLATVACLDSGKTKIDASFGEILVTVEKLKWTIEHGEKALRPESRPTNFLMMYKQNEVRWEPLGVLLACVSWNYPLHNFLSPLISTLFTGSALILKASENTAWSTQHFANVAKAALKACGHSPELVQAICCWPETANHLTSHPDISHITFIGSRPVAHHVAASASKTLTPLCIELGGKDPAIVLDDVKDINKVASILMRGTFQSSGQNCIGIERIICMPNTYSHLSYLLEQRTGALRPGNGLDAEEGNAVDVGAMINDTRFSHLEHLIADAVKHGARCLVGGKRYIHPDHPKGHYFTPTLLVDVTPAMRIAQEELFAPIAVLMRASSLPHAIELANATPFALGASVFGTSRRDLDRVVSDVKAGMVSVNDFGVFYAVSLPFGGVRGSGYGRFGGQEGLRSLCNTKAICRDRWPGLMSTAIPPGVDYPLRSARTGWELCKGVVELGYGMELSRRVAGLWKVIKNG